MKGCKVLFYLFLSEAKFHPQEKFLYLFRGLSSFHLKLTARKYTKVGGPINNLLMGPKSAKAFNSSYIFSKRLVPD